MNLAEIRKMFVRLSGRNDLVKPDGSDDGANFFIQAGQKFIDNYVETINTSGKLNVNLLKGEYSVSFSSRVIEKVLANNGEFTWPLTKISPSDIHRMYADLVSSGPVIGGVPSFYSPISAQTVDSDTNEDYNGLLVYPPSDTNLSLIIFGKFQVSELKEDSQSNFWSIKYPMILILSAMRQLEIVNRNSAGVEDYEKAIMKELLPLERDLVDQEASDLDVLGG